MAEVKSAVERVSPLVIKIGSAQVKAGDESLEKNLKAVSDVLESLWEHIDSYVKKGNFSKYVVGNTDKVLLGGLDTKRPFAGDLETLRKALDTLSFTLTGETYLAVNRLSFEMKSFGAKKTVKDRRASRILAMEIDDRDIDWYEDKPFARGSFGAVFRVKYERRVVVAKIVDLRDVPPKALEATKKEFRNEVALMGEIRSQNTVHILGSVTRPTDLVIIMEYCDGGDLRSRLDGALQGEVQFDKDAQTNMLLDIAFGMRYLHGRPSQIIHRDLKSLNVLIDRDGAGKVADFGMSRSNSMSSSMSAGGASGIGTYAWTAPEVLDDGMSALSVKADVYAFGIIIWECLTYQRPWDGLTVPQIIKAIAKGQRPEVNNAMDKELRALMESCWAEDPKDRPHFTDIVKVRIVTGWRSVTTSI